MSQERNEALRPTLEIPSDIPFTRLAEAYIVKTESRLGLLVEQQWCDNFEELKEPEIWFVLATRVGASTNLSALQELRDFNVKYINEAGRREILDKLPEVIVNITNLNQKIAEIRESELLKRATGILDTSIDMNRSPFRNLDRAGR